jgi:hypothetical protein
LAASASRLTKAVPFSHKFFKVAVAERKPKIIANAHNDDLCFEMPPFGAGFLVALISQGYPNGIFGSGAGLCL